MKDGGFCRIYTVRLFGRDIFHYRGMNRLSRKDIKQIEKRAKEIEKEMMYPATP